MRFVKLTEPELKTLQEGHKNGSQFQFRNRCFCLILSHQGKTVPELAQFFDISRITIYSWFDAWSQNGICGLMNQKGQGRKPILSLQNSEHIQKVKRAIAKNPQSVKSVVAAVEPQLNVKLHPETLKRFLKNLVSASAASAPACVQGKWRLSEKRAKRH
jgi:transposase